MQTRCDVIATQHYKKELKRLVKKYPSILDDVLLLIESLEINPLLGTSLGNNFYKIRLSVTSKGRGNQVVRE